MKSKHHTHFTARPLALEISRMFRPGVAASALLAVPLAFAAPQGGTVTAGQAGIQQSGATTTITQGSQRAAIDWRSFNVGSSEAVNFIQPNASAAILNRVVGNDASAIFGRITANGQVYLINPNGILFGRTAQVDVGSLTASTSNISNANFMAGRLEFSETGKPGARVENQGSITVGEGGFAALVGHNVDNNGVITARLGKVALAAGDAFVLDLYGDKLVNLIVDPAAMNALTDASGNPLAASVDHSGRIVAEGGRVQLSVATVKQLVDNLINVSGVVRATSFATAPGVISLQGDANTRVAVSGTLDASAVEQGQGGKVEVLSDGSTQFTGRIEARGGAAGGDGGQVEVSAKGRIGFMGDVDVSAAHGAQGSLLIDPTNLRITTVASGDSDISADQLRYFLTRGTNVTLAADQNVTVDAEVNGLVAGGGGVRGGGLTLTAGNNLTVNQTIALNDGALNLTATSGTLSAADGALLFTGTGAATLRGGAGVNLGQVLSGGNVDISSANGAVAVRNALISATANGSAAPVASLNVDGAGAVSLNGALVQGNATVRSRNAGVSLATAVIQSTAGNVQVNAATTITTAANNVGLLSAGTVSAAAGQAIDLGAVISTGMATLASTSGGVTVHQAVTGGGAAAVRGLVINAAGPVALAGVNAGIDGILITSSSGDITSNSATPGEGGLISASGVSVRATSGQAGTTAAPLNVRAGDSTNIEGHAGVNVATVLAGGITVSLLADAGSVTVSQPIAAAPGSVDGNTAARPVGIQIRARDDIDLAGGVAGTNSSSIQSDSGTVTLRGSLFSQGEMSVVAGGAISLLNGAGIATSADGGNVLVWSENSTVTLGNAGIRAQGNAANIRVLSSGDMSVNGDIQTRSGTIDLYSRQGAIRVLASTTGTDAAQNATLDAGVDAVRSIISVHAANDVEVGEMIAYNSVQLTADTGNVTLKRGLGGNASGTFAGNPVLLNTGYVDYARGYLAQYRPNVGRMVISAPQGSVELNGLNLDGNANATDTTPGLSVTAGRRIISNNEIAVNKGDIELTGGNTQATDGVYLGSSVYSRGFDSVGADGVRGGGDDQKIGYGIRINGRVLAMFDNTLEMAQLPINTFVTSWYEAGPGAPPPLHQVVTDAAGFLVDATGIRVRNSDGSYQMVGYIDISSFLASDLNIYNVTANQLVAPGYAQAGQTIYGVQGVPSLAVQPDPTNGPHTPVVVQQEIAKIEVANNVANYQDSANVGTLVGATSGTAASRLVQIGTTSVAGVANHTPQTAMHLSDPAPTLTAPSQTPIVSAPTAAGVVAAQMGIGLKVLGFREAGDGSSVVWSSTIDMIDSASSGTSYFSRVDFATSTQLTEINLPATVPVDGIFSVTVQALATRTYLDSSNSLVTQFVRLPTGAGTATHVFQIIPGTSGAQDSAQLIATPTLNNINLSSLSNAAPSGATQVSAWVATGWRDAGSTAKLRLDTPALSAPGTANGVSVTASLYPATGTPLQSGATVAPSYTLMTPDRQQLTPFGAISIPSSLGGRPNTFQVAGVLDDSSSAVTSPSRAGTRVFVYDGVINVSNGAFVFDSNTGVAIPGLGGIPGFNNSTVGFAGVGAGFGAQAGGTAGSTGAGAAIGQAVAGATVPAGQTGSGTAPPAAPSAAALADGSVPALPVAGADGGPSAAAVEGEVIFGTRAASQADLGRGGAVPGSAFNVFKHRYRLATSSGGTLCAPESLQPVQSAESKTERDCSAAK